MKRDDVQAWLDRYLEAWKTYDRAHIRALFSDDAEYRYHPWDEPVRGRDAIAESWIAPSGDASTRDVPGTYDAHYEPYAVDGNDAVAVGRTTYWTNASRANVARVYGNVFLLRFDDDGRCLSFTEWYMKEPGPEPAG